MHIDLGLEVKVTGRNDRLPLLRHMNYLDPPPLPSPTSTHLPSTLQLLTMCDSKPAGQNNKPKAKHMKQNGRLQQVGVAPPTRTKAFLIIRQKKRLFSILTKTCQTWKQYVAGKVFKVKECHLTKILLGEDDNCSTCILS